MGIGAMIGGSVVSGLFGAKSASDAADAQVEATEAAIKEQKRQFDLTREDYTPWRESGTNALAAMNFELGLGPKPGTIPSVITVSGTGGTGTTGGGLNFDNLMLPGIDASKIPEGTTHEGASILWSSPNSSGFSQGTINGIPIGEANNSLERQRMAMMYAGAQPQSGGQAAPSFMVGDKTFGTMEDAQAYANSLGGTEYQGFKATPGYEFRLSEGQNALASMAAARGMRLSGDTLKSAAEYGDNLAANEYNAYYNRLASMAGIGQSATDATAAYGAQSASNIGGYLMAGGDARASGYMGVNNAVQGTMGNLASIYGMQQAGYFG